MYIKPIAGRHVPDPDRGDLLPDIGREVEPHQYWLRRLDDGDVIQAERPQEAVAIDPKVKS